MLEWNSDKFSNCQEYEIKVLWRGSLAQLFGDDQCKLQFWILLLFFYCKYCHFFCCRKLGLIKIGSHLNYKFNNVKFDTADKQTKKEAVLNKSWLKMMILFFIFLNNFFFLQINESSGRAAFDVNLNKLSQSLFLAIWIQFIFCKSSSLLYSIN